MSRSPLAGVGGVWWCGVVALGVGAWCPAGLASGQGSAGAVSPAGQTIDAAVSPAAAREAARSYEAGLLLAGQGEYEAAIGLYIEAIAADPSVHAVYRSLTHAQAEAAKQRLERALAAADAGDLPAASRHARRAAELDGQNADAVSAARSVSDASAVLSAAQRQRFERAQALTEDRQWGLAGAQLAGLVEEAPLFLPGRAALHRARYFEGRARAMADEGVAMIQQGRMTPAVEQLTGAVSIWPYHPDAGDALGQARAGMERAQSFADEAAELFGAGELAAALRSARQALATDSANAAARAVERDAERGLADRAVAAGDAQLDAGAYAAARARYAEAMSYVASYPDARRGMAAAFAAQADGLLDAGRPGASLLALLAGQEHQRRATRDALARAEQRVLATTGVSYALSVPDHAPALGVGSDMLLAELSTQRRPGYFDRRATDEPRYLVTVRIVDTDIVLRRLQAPGASYLYSDGYASGYSRWEKRGDVAAAVTITDRETGRVVSSWEANRWVTFSDTQQYVVGSTWRRSYWTLPTDDAVADRLASDLAAVVWPEVVDRLALARARELRDAADAPAGEATAEEVLELRVAATVLAGQVNEREGERALRELARGFVGEGDAE